MVAGRLQDDQIDKTSALLSHPGVGGLDGVTVVGGHGGGLPADALDVHRVRRLSELAHRLDVSVGGFTQDQRDRLVGSLRPRWRTGDDRTSLCTVDDAGRERHQPSSLSMRR